MQHAPTTARYLHPAPGAALLGDFLGRGFRQHSSFSILGGNKKKKKKRKFVNWLQQFERFVAIATLLRAVLQGAAAAWLLLFPTLCTPHEVRKHPPNAWVCSPHRYPRPEVTKKSQGLFRRLSRSCATRTGSPKGPVPPGPRRASARWCCFGRG